MSELSPHAEADILAASQPLHLPGQGERRILSPVAVERLAAAFACPRWQVEAAALQARVVPLHYVRNLAQFGEAGQIRLLRSAVALVGAGPALERAAELLGLAGVGSIRVLSPEEAGAAADRVADAARNRNASAEVSTGTLPLGTGNPAQALQGLNVVAACLEQSQQEQLLQFACRMARLPLVLGAVEESRGQATTLFPGDAGVALVYKPAHPHLEPDRRGAAQDRKAALMVGAWIAEQILHLLTDEGELLRGKLLYADLGTGQMQEFVL
ncbi:MAG TPA: ThiF family adenylyltransferase [Armatimonadota bacterium]|nr:ThiF family adenylyltransferase [Armatimonadota bacterium]